MPFDFWQKVDPQTRLSELLETHFLLLQNDSPAGIIASCAWSVDADNQRIITMQQRRTDILWRQASLTFPFDAVVADALDVVDLPGDPIVVTIPPFQSGRRGAPRPWRVPVAIALATATAFVAVVVGGPTGAGFALPLAGAAFALVWFMARSPEPNRILAPGNVELDQTNVVEYAQLRLRGHRPEMLPLIQRRQAIRDRVAAIKDEFGALSTDIVYRIEDSALFDNSVPATERFQTALIAWNSYEGEDLARLEELAGAVEITFSVAHDHAATMGLEHLPETARAQARRASNAARLAEGAATEGERTASLHQVARILDALALYYLPTIDLETRAIEAPPGD